MQHDPRIISGTTPACLAAMAQHLAVSPGVARAFLASLSCRQLPGGRYDFTAVWHRMWGIRAVPVAAIEMMQAPLLDLAAVAEIAGVTEKTIRRAGNTNCPSWNLPRHADLGPRLRRYLPAHVEAWFQGQPLEAWLRPQVGPVRVAARGLIPRQASSLIKSQDALSGQVGK